tara:strand:+ start:187 stop:348 length:162 start_codon:yes stop_codon:yes gene_type:complete
VIDGAKDAIRKVAGEDVVILSFLFRLELGTSQDFGVCSQHMDLLSTSRQEFSK